MAGQYKSSVYVRNSDAPKYLKIISYFWGECKEKRLMDELDQCLCHKFECRLFNVVFKGHRSMLDVTDFVDGLVKTGVQMAGKFSVC